MGHQPPARAGTVDPHSPVHSVPGVRSAGPFRSSVSVARPKAGHSLEAFRPAPLDRRLDKGEHCPLQRGGREHLAPAVLGLERLWRFLLIGDALPDLLEDGSRGEPP